MNNGEHRHSPGLVSALQRAHTQPPEVLVRMTHHRPLPAIARPACPGVARWLVSLFMSEKTLGSLCPPRCWPSRPARDSSENAGFGYFHVDKADGGKLLHLVF